MKLFERLLYYALLIGVIIVWSTALHLVMQAVVRGAE